MKGEMVCGNVICEYDDLIKNNVVVGNKVTILIYDNELDDDKIILDRKIQSALDEYESKKIDNNWKVMVKNPDIMSKIL